MIKRSATGFLLGTALALPMAASAATFSIVQISDSQFYAERHPEIMEAQIDWIVANRVAENIVYVAQTGDLKDDQFCDNKTVSVGSGANRTEWQIVNQAFADLDTAGIPYAVLPGNHDFDPVNGFCPPGSGARPLTQYNSLFGPARFAGDPFYGDPGALTPGNRTAGSNEDNFTLFESNGIKFIAINLAYRPAANPVSSGSPEQTWANNLLQTYPDRLGIVTSHYFMETNPGNAFGPYGQQVYDRLRGNRNLFLMLSGHWWGEAWRSDTAGRSGFPPTQALMANYQGMQFPDDTDPATPPGTPTPNPAFINFSSLPAQRGGLGSTDAGFMRIMRFDTETGRVEIETFIPPVIPFKNRTTTLVSTYFPASGAGMGEFTASNLSFPYLGYVSLPNGFDILSCSTPTGGTCNNLIGTIAFPGSSGSQTSGAGFRLTYNESVGFDEGDIQNVSWTIDGGGNLTALSLRLDSDPNCLAGITPPPCSQSTVNFTFSATNLMETTISNGGCNPGPPPTCISSIAIGPANEFDPH